MHNRRGRKELLISIAFLLLGTYLMGIGTGISLLSSLSGDAVAFLWDALSKAFSISVEGANMLFTVTLILIVVKLDWRVLGIGTLVCPVIQNLGLASVRQVFPHTPAMVFGIDILTGISGILILSIGCGIFISAQKGTSAYLGFGQILSGRTGKSYGTTIMLMDGSCFLLASLLSQRLALGPLIATCMSGPAINLTISFLTYFRKKERTVKYENNFGM